MFMNFFQECVRKSLRVAYTLFVLGAQLYSLGMLFLPISSSPKSSPWHWLVIFKHSQKDLGTTSCTCPSLEEVCTKGLYLAKLYNNLNQCLEKAMVQKTRISQASVYILAQRKPHKCFFAIWHWIKSKDGWAKSIADEFIRVHIKDTHSFFRICVYRYAHYYIYTFDPHFIERNFFRSR